MLRALFGLFLACTALYADDSLRVATVDVAGLAQGENRLERLRAFAELLGKQTDVVVLQGLFDGGDLRALNELLEGNELVHTQSYTSGWGGGSGLLIASRYPLENDGFTSFKWAGKPHKPWHRDYYRSKGVALLTVDAPLGSFQLGATAWHPRFSDEEYRWLRIHQALETASAVGDHGVIAPESARDSGRVPLLVAGSLDCDPGALPLRLMSEASGADPVRADMGPGWILTRPGGVWGLRLVRVQALFQNPTKLAGGASEQLVDHPGWVAEFRKRPYPNGPPLASTAPFRATADRLLPLVREEVEVTRQEGQRATLAGLGLFLVGGGLYAIGWILGRPRARKARKRKPRPSGEGELADSSSGSGQVDSGKRAAARPPRRRGCCLFGCLSLIVVHGALWLIYQGRVFVPYELGGLESTVTRLEPPEVIVLDGPR
ncbi:MAG: hypothetical protein KDD82_00275 [Planctomycetes bacterium]|nr:hypothetical protein [Planctomycetota bacterium]